MLFVIVLLKLLLVWLLVFLIIVFKGDVLGLRMVLLWWFLKLVKGWVKLVSNGLLINLLMVCVFCGDVVIFSNFMLLIWFFDDVLY